MQPQPPRPKPTDTLFPDTTLFRSTAAEVTSAIERADQLIEAGRTMAGWIGYEAGYALEPRLHARLQPGGTPGALLRLFAFDDRTSIPRSEEHTSELQSLMRISYAVFCLKKQNNQ